MSEITIRTADFDDPAQAAAIVELVEAYALEPQGGGKPIPETVRQSMIPTMQATPGAFTLLAYAGEQAIGAAICFRGFSTFSGRQVINVHDLSVRAGYRGRGIGSRLLAAVENHARELGCSKVTLEVREANPDAERLYRRLGYSDPDGFATRFLDKPLTATDD